MMVKQTDMYDNIAVSFKKLEDIKLLIENSDKKHGITISNIERKIVPLNNSISVTENSLKSTNEIISNIEKYIEKNNEEILEMKHMLTRAANAMEAEKINKDRAKEKDEKDEKDEKELKIEKNFAHEKFALESQNIISMNAIEEFKNEIELLKESLTKSARETEESLKEEVSNNIKFLNEKVHKIKQENEESFKEVNEKLN